MEFNPLLYSEKYRISTNRLQTCEYKTGFYHIVVCTNGRKCYFGYIDQEQMYYSVIGQFAKECIEGLNAYYPYVEVLCSQVMPNHIHLLVHLFDNTPSEMRTGEKNIEETGEIPHREKMQRETVCNTVSTGRSRLSIVVAGMKRTITMYAKAQNIPFGWQPRFYDTIIRSATQYSETNYYIHNNVIHWHDDTLHPDKQ